MPILLTRLAAAGLLISCPAAQAAVLTVNFDSGDFQLLNEIGSPLGVGNPLVDGDGFVLQLGYFSDATAANNFLGVWVPLTGEGSANTENITGTTINFDDTSVGDAVNRGAGGPGEFYLSLTFDTSTPSKSQNLPPVGKPLAIRFYNSTNLATATYYNTVSNDGWLWLAMGDPGPSQPVMTISLSDATPAIEWESISDKGQDLNTAFRTTISVPEPSTAMLALVSVVGLFGYRRRKSS